MALQDLVVDVIKGTGTKFLKDLFHPQDAEQLVFVAAKLIQLDIDAKAASTDDEKTECKEGALQWCDTLKVLALSRVNTAEKELIKSIESSFVSVLLTSLNPLLGTLVSIVGAV